MSQQSQHGKKRGLLVHVLHLLLERVAYYVKFSLAIEPASSHIAGCDMIRVITYKGSATFSNTKQPLLQLGQVYVRVDRLSSVDIHKDRIDEVPMNVELEGTKCKTLFTFDHDIAEAANI
jgi:hypothetical protein